MADISYYDTASEHARTVVSARDSLITLGAEYFPRESVANLERFADYMLRNNYMGERFYRDFARFDDPAEDGS